MHYYAFDAFPLEIRMKVYATLSETHPYAPGTHSTDYNSHKLRGITFNETERAILHDNGAVRLTPLDIDAKRGVMEKPAIKFYTYQIYSPWIGRLTGDIIHNIIHT